MTTANLNDTIVDSTLNVRTELDESTVEHYREVLSSCPPVVVFDTDEGLLLADGFHRVEAARREGWQSIKIDRRVGTRSDAIEFAATANLTHGRPLTKSERIEAVRRVKEVHPDWGKKRIASATGLPVTTVGRYLTELERGPVDPYEAQVIEGKELVTRIQDTWHMLSGLYHVMDAGIPYKDGEPWTFEAFAEAVGMNAAELHAFLSESPYVETEDDVKKVLAEGAWGLLTEEQRKEVSSRIAAARVLPDGIQPLGAGTEKTP